MRFMLIKAILSKVFGHICATSIDNSLAIAGKQPKNFKQDKYLCEAL